MRGQAAIGSGPGEDDDGGAEIRELFTADRGEEVNGGRSPRK